MKAIFDPVLGALRLSDAQNFGVKGDYILAALSAYDKIASITYLNEGEISERISSVVYSSAEFPDADVTKNIFYLDEGTMNQRIDKIEWSGAILSPQSLRKTYQYSLSGIKYKVDGFFFELF